MDDEVNVHLIALFSEGMLIQKIPGPLPWGGYDRKWN